MNNDALAPHWLKPAALAVLLCTIGFVALILLLVILGIADPKPLGTLTTDQSEPVDLTTDRADQIIYHSAIDAVHCPCTIEATLRQISGAPTNQYGLWVRTPTESIIIALNGNAYYAIFDAANHYLSEPQRFTWLLPQPEPNKIRLDLAADSTATLRLNDEIAATFTWLATPPIEIGYYLSSPDGTSTISIHRLRIWSSD